MAQFQFNHSAFMGVQSHLESSIKAEQIFCSIVTEMTFLPQMKDSAGLKTVHKENYETSYHRNTGAGNLQRLIDGQADELLILMTVECLIETHQHDKTAEKALEKIEVSDEGVKSWVEAAKQWHTRRKQALRQAAKSLHAIIGPELWAKGAALAE